jgi:hypothetical protein
MAPELRIAVAPAATDTMDVSDLEIGGDTSIIALQPAQHQIIVWDKFGRVRTTFGKDQLKAPAAIGWYAGALWAWEPSLDLLTRFQTDGSVVEQVRVLQNARFPGKTALHALLSDSALLISAVIAQDSQSGRTTRALLRVERTGAVLDTVAVLHDVHNILAIRSGNAGLVAEQPFAERSFAAYSDRDGMVVIAHPDSVDRKPVLRVSKLNLLGDTVFTTTLTYEPQRFDAVLVAPVVGRLMQASRRAWTGPAPGDDQQLRLLRDALYKPRLLPTVSGLVVASDGRILVRREEGAEQVNWTILENTNGSIVANQRGPAKARILAAGGPFSFAAEHEPGAIPEVVRYRLLPN